MKDHPRNVYRIHGVVLESEIPLEGRRLNGGAGSREHGAADYLIRLREPRTVPHAQPPGRLLAELRVPGLDLWTVADSDKPEVWTVRYAGDCDATIDRPGRRIDVYPALGSNPGLLPTIVGGGVLAHALAADGHFALHASAVAAAGRGLAIGGQSGAGKSTLAALLCGAGARLITDDTLRVEVTPGGATCFPGGLGLRLRTRAEGLAEAVEGADWNDAADGRRIVFPDRVASAPVALAAVVVPVPSRTAQSLTMQRLDSMAGMIELLGCPRLIGWRDSQQISSLFARTTELARAVDVYRAVVPWGPPFPPHTAEGLLAAAGLQAPASAGSGRGT